MTDLVAALETACLPMPEWLVGATQAAFAGATAGSEQARVPGLSALRARRGARIGRRSGPQHRDWEQGPARVAPDDQRRSRSGARRGGGPALPGHRGPEHGRCDPGLPLQGSSSYRAPGGAGVARRGERGGRRVLGRASVSVADHTSPAHRMRASQAGRSATVTVASCDMPGDTWRNRSAGSSKAILTGPRWTTLTKLPVAFSAGSSAPPRPPARLEQLGGRHGPFGSPAEQWRLQANVDRLLATCRPADRARLQGAKRADEAVYGTVAYKPGISGNLR